MHIPRMPDERGSDGHNLSRFVMRGGTGRSPILGSHVLAAEQLPTLWDPEDLFAHLALWAGAPAITVVIVVWVLGIYGSLKSWFKFGTGAVKVASAAPGMASGVRENVRGWTTVEQRAMVRLSFYSVFTVAFSYMLAEVVYVVVQMAEIDPTAPFSVSYMRSSAVAVTPWPSPVALMVVLEVVGIGMLGFAFIANMPRVQKLITFLGGVARAIAWTGTVVLGLLTFGGLIDPLLSSNQGPSAAVPMSFVATTAVTMVLCLGLALSLTRVREASEKIFKVTPQMTHVSR